MTRISHTHSHTRKYTQLLLYDKRKVNSNAHSNIFTNTSQVRDSAKILGKLKRDLVSDVASRRRAIDIAMKRLRARDVAEMKAYEVTRDEIRALRNARDLEAAYTQRLARRLENATKDPVSCTGFSVRE